MSILKEDNMVNSNQIDLGKIYGLSGSPEERCMNMNSELIDFPTLEQIAPTWSNGNMGNINQIGVNNGSSATANTNTCNGIACGMGNSESTSVNATTNGMTETNDFTMNNNGMQDDITFSGAPAFSNTATGQIIPMSSPMRDSLGTANPQPIYEYNQPYSVTSQNIQYLNSFMRTQIGRMIEVNFLLGSTNMMNLEGRLLGVGANFILMNEHGTNNATAVDFYNIKYIRFFY